MTETTINTSYLLFNTASASKSNSIDLTSLKTSGSSSMSFESTMKNTVKSQTSDSSANTTTTNGSSNTDISSETTEATGSTDTDNVDNNTDSTKEVKDDVQSENVTGTEDTSGLEVVQDELTDYAEQIVDIIKEFSGASDEDIQKAFEELGINQIDLLDVNNVVKVMQNLTQTENVSELMTNEQFATSIKDVMGIIDDAKQTALTDFGIENMQFGTVVKEISNMENIVNVTSEETTGEIESVTIQNDINDNEAVNVINSETDANTNDDTQDSEYKAEFKQNQNQSETETIDVSSSEEDDVEGIKITSGGTETSSNNEFAENNNFLNTFAEKLTQVEGEVIETADAQKIVEQIVNEIKTSVKADTTSIEMQLYPENLGKVGIEVVSKDGELTANITVKDSVVKEIVQTHLDVLKENFNNQGIKVEAVEISVASRGFDENQDQKQAEEENASNTKKAFIDTSEFDDEGEMLEQEEIQREMILKGATVSYSA